VTRYRLILILAGAVAVAAIAWATVMANRAMVPPALLAASLLGTYAVGLGAGRLVLGKGD
jgi:hypothetical protein